MPALGQVLSRYCWFIGQGVRKESRSHRPGLKNGLRGALESCIRNKGTPRLLGLPYDLLIGEAELCRRGGRSPRIDPRLLALLGFALLHLLEEDAHRLRRVVDDSWAMDA